MAGSIGNQLFGKIALDIIDIAKISIGNILIYSAGNVVTYHVDTELEYQEEVDADETVLFPKTFAPVKDGWDFIGWRLDDVAGGDVLENLTMGDDPITLYAVFRQNVTLSYDGNGYTGGSTDAETKQRYYNNGTVADPTFIVKTNGFSKTDYTFLQWRLNDSEIGTVYAPDDMITLSEDSVLYADWIGTPYTITLTPDGWTGPTILCQQFGGTPGIAVNQYNKSWGIYVQGYVQDNINGWAQFGFEKVFDTHGCKYVDITVPRSYAFYESNLGGGGMGGDIKINGTTIIAARTVIPDAGYVKTNVPISGDTITLMITGNSLGQKNLSIFNKVQSLYFHN